MATAEKSGRKKKFIALFNFDNTFSLDSVEDLLRATKAKVDFEIWIAKHYFPLGLMPELCKSIIPKMEMDVAVLVVNANESCLFINNEKSGSGYTKMYKALLQATGDKVLVVIGGDDKYKSQTERDGNVLSSWAKRIMISQLNEQFLDERKGFVFSWDKKHRQIHEQALLHYFDPENENFGLKKFKHVLSQDAKSASVSDEETKETDGNSGQNQLRDNDAGNDKSPGRSKEWDESCNRDLVILGCNASDDSLSAVYQVIEDLKPKLNLKSDPPIVSQPPGLLKSYLMKNKVKFCLLVVDADAVKSALENSQRRVEYEEVLKTALDQVVEKVIVTICGPPILLESDEAAVTQVVNSILQRENKAFLLWVKGGKLQLSSEVLLQILQSVQKTSQSAGDVRARHKYHVSPLNYSDGERTQRSLTKTQSTDYSGECDTSSVPKLKQSRYHDQQSRGVHLRSYSTDGRVTTVPASNQPYDQPSRGGQVTSHSSCEGVRPFPAAPAGNQPYYQQSQGAQVVLHASQITQNVPRSSPSNQPHNQLSRDGTIKSLSADGGEATATQSANLTGVHGGWVYNLKGENVELMIKAYLRNGKISKENHWVPNWTVPEYIRDDLLSKCSDTSEAELLIFYDESETLRISVTPKKNFLRNLSKLPMQKESPHELLAPNESLMLKTLIRDGKVSLKLEDVETRYPYWHIHEDIIRRIEQNEWATSKADLSIISDELGNLKYVVQIGAFHKVHTFFNKLTHIVKEK